MMTPPFEDDPSGMHANGFQIPVDELFGPSIDDAWDTTLNNMDPIGSGQLGVLTIFKDLNAPDYTAPKFPASNDAKETSNTDTDKDTAEGKEARPNLGAAGSRHGSNDRLEAHDTMNDSPRESLKSQQTAIGMIYRATAQPRLRLAAQRSTRPVRTKSLPKRLADANIETTLPKLKNMISMPNLTVPQQQQQQQQQQVSCSMEISAQSDNLSSEKKRKHAATRSASVFPYDQTSMSMVVSSTQLGRSESRGKPSFAELVAAGIMEPGTHAFQVGSHSHVTAEICEDGSILYAGALYRAVSKFALQVLRLRNPSRQSCDGWKDVSWRGQKLEKVREMASENLRGVRKAR